MTRLLPAAGLVMLLFVASPAKAQSTADFTQTSLQLTDASMFDTQVLSAAFAVSDPFKNELTGGQIFDMPFETMQTDPSAGAVLPLSDDLTFDPTKAAGTEPKN